jgi:outer membrane protein assembly factor BamD (BamD/ComL family)
MKLSFKIIKNFLFLIVLIILLPACVKDQPKRTTRRMQQKLAQPTIAKNKIVQPAVAHKNPKTLTMAELQVAKEYTEAINNKAQTIVYLEHMVKQCSDPTLLKDVYLELADLYFEQGTMDLAAKLYTAYITLYPGSPLRAYVHYQAILCKFYSTFGHDRDQTKTEDTLKLTELYLDMASKQTDVYKEYCDEVASIQKQCYKKMYAHSLDVFNFFYKQSNYVAAQVHLDEIKRLYLTHLQEEIEPDLLALECNIATRLGNTKLVVTKQAELQAKYPQLATIKLAANNPKTDHVARF